MNVPTGPYRPVAPAAFAVDPYLPWLINKVVRLGRDNGYANLVDDGLELLLADFNVRRPAGGFVDSDGRNARGTLNGGYDADGYDENGYNRNGFDKNGFNADGYDADGNTRADAIEDMVNNWDADYAANVLVALADRVS